jgi:putative CocE/NonD family hydrolase
MPFQVTGDCSMKMTRCFQSLLLGFALLLFACPVSAQETTSPAKFIRENYTRATFKIPVRDGVRLHTIVYMPRDQAQTYPILLLRTPYGIGPYDDEQFRQSLGPNRRFAFEKYIFAYQDVRGRYMSEGVFENMRPQLARPGGTKDIDESTDTFDTIDWLVKNVPNNNGKVGQYGISYPGFYTSAGMINAHPALKASSPQAPIADWFFDDFYHRGALFLTHAFNFFSGFGQPRPEPTTSRSKSFNFGTPDGYQFFLDLGPLRNANTRWFKDRIAYWNTLGEHNTYDAFWKARNLLPHLRKVAPAVMTVGGWYDAEDLYGIFQTYRAVEKQNPGIFNVLVIGPWAHGGWAGPDGSRLGDAVFGSSTAAFFQEKIELPFFNHFLKGKEENELPEAYVFQTGVNHWRQFDAWPPRGTAGAALYFNSKGRLTREMPKGPGDAYDAFISDPNHPVPYTDAVAFGMLREYMTGDQRFAARRPDVVVYQTEPLEDDVTLAGPLRAELFVSTTGTDSDWVVKLIDVFPPNAGTNPDTSRNMGGYQMMVRSEVIRGRFRQSYEKPVPFVPDEPAQVSLPLQDVLHTFKKGHRIMVQVCSSWFPLTDRNPQKYVPNIFQADDSDFIVTNQKIYRSPMRASAIHFGIAKLEKKE